MYYYFSSETPAAIKVNGAFCGILSKDLKQINIDSLSPFIELCPVSTCQPCANFLLDNNFFCCPPNSVILTDLKGGYLIKFSPQIISSEFKVIEQHKSSRALVTVFNESGLKLSIETPKDFYAETVNLNINRAEIKEFDINGVHFISVLFENENKFLVIYEVEKNIRKIFFRQVNEYCTDGEFFTVEKFCDMAKHQVKTFWEYKNGAFCSSKKECMSDNDFNADNLNEKLIPYCFLEEYLAGCDWDKFLCGSVLKNKNRLSGFLGKFIGIMPPPRFRSGDEIGLIYTKSDNLYFVEYFKFCLDNRKICNIIKCE